MSSGTTPPGGGGTGSSGGWSSFSTVERATIIGTAAGIASVLIAAIALFGPFGSDDKDSGKGGSSISSTTSTEPGTTTSAPTSSDMFDPAPAPYSNGTVPVDGISGGPFGITTRGGSNWSADFYNADIVVTSTGVEVANNALYAVVPDPSFPACWKAAYSVPSPTWEQVPPGTVLCIQTKDKRIGIVKFVWQKDREGELTKTTVSGVIWSPKR